MLLAAVRRGRTGQGEQHEQRHWPHWKHGGSIRTAIIARTIAKTNRTDKPADMVATTRRVSLPEPRRLRQDASPENAQSNSPSKATTSSGIGLIDRQSLNTPSDPI